MKVGNIVLPLLLTVAAATPAAAYTSPVNSHELNRFVGTNLKGKAFSNLGVVAAVSRPRGTIALVGRHGEVATIHNSMLVRTGMQLRAPDLSYGDIARASDNGRSAIPITRGGAVIIRE